MQKPAPYIDGEGNRFYNMEQAAEVVEGVSATTLWRWASKGVTSFGFNLNVRREPLIHDLCLAKMPSGRKWNRVLVPGTVSGDDL